ncbi:MAG: ParA family protein, partial [Hyphomicrobiaceae bacterium]
GKSTLVTNLAAAFTARGERVLTVDLDYQGSHSNLATLQSHKRSADPQAIDPDAIVHESLVDHLFREVLDPNWPALAIRQVQSNFHYIPAFYEFEQSERRIEYQWALGLTDDDVRYRLARALLSADVQDQYDRVLIDAPPRFTLGFVNGFCTATHMYVPTVVDSLSALAVRAFAQQFRDLRPIVNPSLRWPGIIGTMTFVNPNNPLQLANTAAPYADRAERIARARLRGNEPVFTRNPVIVRDAKLARATADGIAYFNDSSVRSMFDGLAAVIDQQAPRRT